MGVDPTLASRIVEGRTHGQGSLAAWVSTLRSPQESWRVAPTGKGPWPHGCRPYARLKNRGGSHPRPRFLGRMGVDPTLASRIVEGRTHGQGSLAAWVSTLRSPQESWRVAPTAKVPWPHGCRPYARLKNRGG